MAKQRFYITNVLIFFSVCAYVLNITPTRQPKLIKCLGKNLTETNTGLDLLCLL